MTTETSSFPAVPSSTVIQSADEGRVYSHSTPVAVTVISCGVVSSAPKVSDEGDTSSDAVVDSPSVGEQAAASRQAAATNNIFFIVVSVVCKGCGNLTGMPLPSVIIYLIYL